MLSTNGHGPKQAILYARVSTDEQARSGYSLAKQLEALRAYAAQEGYEVLEEVTDPGQSGASLERPGIDQVRDLVAAGGVSVVLAQDRDRFAREPAYLYILKKEFEERGCALRALNSRGDDTPEGELTDGILDQLGRYERAKVAERSPRGKRRAASEGKVITAPECALRLPIRHRGQDDSAERSRTSYRTADLRGRRWRCLSVVGKENPRHGRCPHALREGKILVPNLPQEAHHARRLSPARL
jgi:DNA invertase Pin-like site-specific DNA recombinase